MLSDEENEALEILKEFKENGFHLLNLKYESRVSTNKHIENSIDTLLNLIEKQSKEIEELKQEKEYLNCIIESDEDNYINKDKIKAKIEEIKDEFKEYENGQEWEIQDEIRGQIEVLQSLLEKE